MTRRTLVIRYTAFAVFAVMANLATQRLVLFGADVVDGARFAAALAAGNAGGPRREIHARQALDLP